MRKIKILISFAVVLFSFLLIIYGVYNLSLSNKSRMLNYLQNSIVDYSGSIDKANNTKVTYESVVTSGKKTGNIKGELYFDSINKLYANLFLEANGMGVNYEYYKNNTETYIRLKDVINKFIKLQDNSKKYSNSNDVASILKLVREAVFKNVEEKSFEKKDENIQVHDDNLESTKYTMNITKKDLVNIYNYLDNKSEDYLLLRMLLSLVSDNINSISDLKDNTKMFSFSIYVSDNKIVRYLVSIPAQNNEGVKSSLDIDFSKYKYNNDEKLYYHGVKITAFDKVLYNIDIIQQDSNHYEIIGSSDDENYQINGVITSDYLYFALRYNDEERIVINVTKNKIEDSKTEYKVIANFDQKTTFDIDLVVEKNINIPDIDLSNSIEYNKLNRKDLKKVNDLGDLLKDFKIFDY